METSDPAPPSPSPPVRDDSPHTQPRPSSPRVHSRGSMPPEVNSAAAPTPSLPPPPSPPPPPPPANPRPDSSLSPLGPLFLEPLPSSSASPQSTTTAVHKPATSSASCTSQAHSQRPPRPTAPHRQTLTERAVSSSSAMALLVLGVEPGTHLLSTDPSLHLPVGAELQPYGSRGRSRATSPERPHSNSGLVAATRSGAGVYPQPAVQLHCSWPRTGRVSDSNVGCGGSGSGGGGGTATTTAAATAAAAVTAAFRARARTRAILLDPTRCPFSAVWTNRAAREQLFLESADEYDSVLAQMCRRDPALRVLLKELGRQMAAEVAMPPPVTHLVPGGLMELRLVPKSGAPRHSLEPHQRHALHQRHCSPPDLSGHREAPPPALAQGVCPSPVPRRYGQRPSCGWDVGAAGQGWCDANGRDGGVSGGGDGDGDADADLTRQQPLREGPPESLNCPSRQYGFSVLRLTPCIVRMPVTACAAAPAEAAAAGAGDTDDEVAAPVRRAASAVLPSHGTVTPRPAISGGTGRGGSAAGAGSGRRQKRNSWSHLWSHPGGTAAELPASAAAAAGGGGGAAAAWERPALLIEHVSGHNPSKVPELYERLQRDCSILSGVSAIITLFDLHGNVVHQNALSVDYLGLHRPQLAQTAPRLFGGGGAGGSIGGAGGGAGGSIGGTGGGAGGSLSPNFCAGSFERRSGGSTTCRSVTGCPSTLERLFELDPNKLQEMLDVVLDDRPWMSIVRVPASLLDGLGAGDSDTDTESQDGARDGGGVESRVGSIMIDGARGTPSHSVVGSMPVPRSCRSGVSVPGGGEMLSGMGRALQRGDDQDDLHYGDAGVSTPLRRTPRSTRGLPRLSGGGDSSSFGDASGDSGAMPQHSSRGRLGLVAAERGAMVGTDPPPLVTPPAAGAALRGSARQMELGARGGTAAHRSRLGNGLPPEGPTIDPCDPSNGDEPAASKAGPQYVLDGVTYAVLHPTRSLACPASILAAEGVKPGGGTGNGTASSGAEGGGAEGGGAEGGGATGVAGDAAGGGDGPGSGDGDGGSGGGRGLASFPFAPASTCAAEEPISPQHGLSGSHGASRALLAGISMRQGSRGEGFLQPGPSAIPRRARVTYSGAPPFGTSPPGAGGGGGGGGAGGGNGSEKLVANTRIAAPRRSVGGGLDLEAMTTSSWSLVGGGNTPTSAHPNLRIAIPGRRGRRTSYDGPHADTGATSSATGSGGGPQPPSTPAGGARDQGAASGSASGSLLSPRGLLSGGAGHVAVARREPVSVSVSSFPATPGKGTSTPLPRVVFFAAASVQRITARHAQQQQQQKQRRRQRISGPGARVDHGTGRPGRMGEQPSRQQHTDSQHLDPPPLLLRPPPQQQQAQQKPQPLAEGTRERPLSLSRAASGPEPQLPVCEISFSPPADPEDAATDDEARPPLPRTITAPADVDASLVSLSAYGTAQAAAAASAAAAVPAATAAAAVASVGRGSRAAVECRSTSARTEEAGNGGLSSDGDDGEGPATSRGGPAGAGTGARADGPPPDTTGSDRNPLGPLDTSIRVGDVSGERAPSYAPTAHSAAGGGAGGDGVSRHDDGAAAATQPQSVEGRSLVSKDVAPVAAFSRTRRCGRGANLLALTIRVDDASAEEAEAQEEDVQTPHLLSASTLQPSTAPSGCPRDEPSGSDLEPKLPFSPFVLALQQRCRRAGGGGGSGGGDTESTLTSESEDDQGYGGADADGHNWEGETRGRDEGGGSGEEAEAEEALQLLRGARWHEVTARPFVDPVSRRRCILLMQMDVTAKIEAERQLAELMDAEHKILEQIFPRHVLEHMALDTARAAQRPACAFEAFRRDCSKLATKHAAVTILFADIKGFTSMSQEVEPEVVMSFLNELYNRFDTLLDVYGVYKVETIGDCYMVAGGLIRKDEEGFPSVHNPGAVDPLHAVRVMSFAKAMLREAATMRLPSTGETLKVRVGIHSGPVMSGVVGTRMPRFCLFGDTVNTASRMESTGQPGVIHVSQDTRNLLPKEIWEPTGGVEVKGKGLMATYIWQGNEKEAAPHLLLGSDGTVLGSAAGRLADLHHHPMRSHTAPREDSPSAAAGLMPRAPHLADGRPKRSVTATREEASAALHRCNPLFRKGAIRIQGPLARGAFLPSVEQQEQEQVQQQSPQQLDDTISPGGEAHPGRSTPPPSAPAADVNDPAKKPQHRLGMSRLLPLKPTSARQ